MRPVDIFLIVCGVIYIVKPNIFRRGIWTKTSLMQRSLTPEVYVRVMRLLGMFLIVMGLWNLLFQR